MKSIHGNRPVAFWATSPSSSSTEAFITKNSSLDSSDSTPLILLQTLYASSVFPLCIRNRGDSGMKSILEKIESAQVCYSHRTTHPKNMIVGKTKEDPRIYHQLPLMLRNMAATTYPKTSPRAILN